MQHLGVESPLGLGTWSWGNKLLWRYDESMDGSLEAGFAHMKSQLGSLFCDTGDSYGTFELEGRAESLLGAFSYRLQQPATIAATKIAPYPWRVTSKQFVDAFRRSLNRMNAHGQCTPVAQIHWSTAPYLFGSNLQDMQLWDGLYRCYQEGLASAVGTSNYGPKQLHRLHDFLSVQRSTPLLSVQVQYSLLSRVPEWNGLIEKANELGIQVIGYSPLALGILTGKFNQQQQMPGVRGIGFNAALQSSTKLMEVMQIIAERHKATLAQIALAWCIGKGVLPIVGVRSLEQAQANCGAVHVQLSEAEMNELDGVSASCVQTTQNPFTSA